MESEAEEIQHLIKGKDLENTRKATKNAVDSWHTAIKLNLKKRR